MKMSASTPYNSLHHREFTDVSQHLWIKQNYGIASTFCVEGEGKVSQWNDEQQYYFQEIKCIGKPPCPCV